MSDDGETHRKPLPARVLEYLAENGGVARLKAISEATGAHPVVLRRLVEDGSVSCPVRGVYCLPHMLYEFRSSLAFVFARAPEATLCLHSAAAWHGLVTRDPTATWIAIGANARPPAAPEGTELRTVRWRGNDDVGVELVTMHGVPVRITNEERTICDLFSRLAATEEDEDLAVESLASYISMRQDVTALEDMAAQLGGSKDLHPYVAAMKRSGLRF